MKVNRYGRAAILSASQITLLFNEGFTQPRDRALFGFCLYAAARIIVNPTENFAHPADTKEIVEFFELF